MQGLVVALFWDTRLQTRFNSQDPERDEASKPYLLQNPEKLEEQRKARIRDQIRKAKENEENATEINVGS